MLNKFKISSDYKTTPDQQNAIDSLVKGVENGIDYQVLLGVTGSGKTFTVANVIEKLQKPALIISHNKTLAGQLYQEFRDFFPENAVSYFVSYYDFYQPEAYIPRTDTYIEKDADINELIEKLRLASTTNLLTRSDTIVVASVSCIYNIGSPREYGNFVFEIAKGMKIERSQIIDRLVELQYERSDFGFHRGTFRVRGNVIDIYPAYQDDALRIELDGNFIKNVIFFNPITGSKLEKIASSYKKNTSEVGIINKFVLYPAKHFITDPVKNKNVFIEIENDLKIRFDELSKTGKVLEAHRLKQRVTYDIEMIKEVGYVKGIENYSRYFDGRKPGEPPYTLLDYFKEPFGSDWLVFIDESHMSFPQIRGMYNGDQARKRTLIDYGFRLPAAIDNRPLMFEEFIRRIPGFIATSATPAEWEINMAEDSAKSVKGRNIKNTGIVQQLLRPTGIPDPIVEIRPVESEVEDVINEIKKRAGSDVSLKRRQRTLVTTLTKKMAEDLSNFLKEKGLSVQYLHSDIKTLERSDILEKLRKGDYDVIVGVNLLREGLDLPEVSLVAILDADKEGFLRSEVSLVQTMGRAARHVEGRVILYADNITGSIKRALIEVRRRRRYQLRMNKKYGIIPKNIVKPIRERLVEEEGNTQIENLISQKFENYKKLSVIDINGLTPLDRKRIIVKLQNEMKIAAQDLNFEFALEIRDKIKKLSN